MAITKSEALRSNTDASLNYMTQSKKVDVNRELLGLSYAVSPEKTDGGQLVSVQNLDSIETAAKEMRQLRERFGKTKGREGYMCYQSFAPGEITPELAHRIGVQLAAEVWPDYQVVVATHIDREHIHNHFVFNSVCMTDGHKYRENFTDYYRLRDTSDRLCKENGLSVIVPGERKTGKREIAKADAARAVAIATDVNELAQILAQSGYTLKVNPKHERIIVTHPEIDKPVRIGKRIEILEQLRQNKVSLPTAGPQAAFVSPPTVSSPAAVRPMRTRRMVAPLRPKACVHGLRARYLRYLYLLDAVQRKPQYYQQHLGLRQEVKRLHTISAQLTFLSTHKINSMAELNTYLADGKAQVSALYKERARLYRQAEKTPLPERGGITAAISEKTAQISEKRKDVNHCQAIAKRQRNMTRNQEIQKQIQKEREM